MTAEIKSVQDADVAGKRVVVRVDCNVPLAEGRVGDDARIKAVLPTLELLHKNGAAKIVLLAHLGRPGGIVNESLRMAPVEARLRELTTVPFELQENLRFDPGEESNDDAFVKKLSELGDLYVNDAFADSHREHASIVGVPKFLPSYAGLQMERELQHLAGALTPPQGSLAIIGGAKFETKEPLLAKLASTYKQVLLGGALEDDLLKARGMPFGASLVSPTPVSQEVASNAGIVIPTDVVVDAAGKSRVALVNDIRAEERVVDIGPATAAAWGELIQKAPFVLWNGPMGIYERGFTEGTDTLAKALSAATCKAVVGGGDTLAALAKFTFDPERIFVSTGGGAMLDFLTHGTLPGLEALKK